ncbi:hypothetical protein FOCC_FOCC017303 [Frankliniella occidentalis]|uniref:Uncharacterized protein LOC113215884 n=1 Tax=Frankliniella occidentalis TaxID=133901 RepID=A0A6J1TKH4_FRAOC|nr:uncharacterized protein LOC113215884 [Frankliniella occidentalis]KAE8737236.1 hypothetical protein FOCC_FOCC017303 [Frankliniella occidentalis]
MTGDKKRRTYKSYVEVGKPPPRSTLCTRRKKQAQIEAERKSKVEPVVQTAEEEQVDLSANSHRPVDSSPRTRLECPGSTTPQDTSTDDEVSPEPGKTLKRRKKRKVNTKVHRCDTDPNTGSSDDPASLSDTGPESEQSCVVHDREPQPCVPLMENDIIEAECSDECQEDPPPSKENSDLSEPLCRCVKTTIGDILFMTLSIGLRHSLTWAAQVDILKMWKSVFSGKKIPLSKPTYQKMLNAVNPSDIEYQVYCKNCNTYLGKREAWERFCAECNKSYENGPDCEFFESCTECHKPLQERQVKVQVRTCTNVQCKKDVKLSETDNLVSVSIESQLQKFVKDEKFVNNIMRYRFNRQYIPGVYSDIYDGAMYQKYFDNNGVLSSPYNFSYTFFTDGIAYSKSGAKTIWPIYLTINELPYEERKNYYILAAVYCGNKDPNEQWFFPAFVSQANQLSVNGFKWNHNGENVTSRVIPLCLIADSGARYKLINMQMFGAIFGCTYCYHETERIGVQRYLIDLTQPPAPLRTLDSYKLDLVEVEARKHEIQEKNRAYRGVRGNCVLNRLHYFDITESCPVDYFHCVLIGVTKRHMELLLGGGYKSYFNNMKKQDAMDNLIASIDEGILKIQSTTSVIRDLRPLKDIAHWKASEYRSWLLFYCIVCLKGFLKEKHLEHLAMLSRAANLLLQKTVTRRDIETALGLFKLYSFYFQESFTERNMVYNIHLLSHIPKCVLSFGPLWTHNSFSYESKNGDILQLVKSPHHVPLQVARKFLMYQSLPIVCSALARGKETVLFCDKLLNYKHLVKYDRASDNNCVLLGKPTLKSLSQNDFEKLSRLVECGSTSQCLMYDRMYFKKKKYSTASYGQGKKNNDSYAFLDSGECVKILHIIKYPVGNRVLLNCELIRIVGTPVVEIPDTRFDHVVRAVDSGDKVLLNVERLDKPCCRIQLRSKQYIAKIAYACTIE